MLAYQSGTLLKGVSLVSLKTSLKGNVNYSKVDILHENDGQVDRTEWNTTRTIADIAEHEAAKKARSRAVSILRSACSLSAFGMLCPAGSEAKLTAAITEARAVVDNFNKQARLSRIGFYVMVGAIANDDLEATRAINSEVRELLDAMAVGVKSLDAKAIRDAANKATQLGQVLTADAEAKVRTAIEAARKAARRIAKAGYTAATTVDKEALRRITQQQAAFLDLGDEITISNPEAEVSSIDLEPLDDIPDEMGLTKAAALDMEGT